MPCVRLGKGLDGVRWQLKQINIIGGTLGSGYIEAFEGKLKEMAVKKKACNTIRREHVRHLLEA